VNIGLTVTVGLTVAGCFTVNGGVEVSMVKARIVGSPR